MTRPVIHIGYHKTATSWFQRHFYPEVRNRRYVPRKLAKATLVNPSALRFDPQAARQALGANEGLIICEEALCGHYENAGLNGCLSKDIAHRIQSTYPDARIVVFIRRQPDIIKAAYLQYLRRGGTFSAKRFIFPYHYERHVDHKRFKRPMFDLDHFDYRPLIRHYQTLFGAESVHVFPFEAFLADADTFLDDYTKRLDLDVDLRHLNRRPANVSYRSATALLARVVNHFGVSDVSQRGCALPVIPKSLRIHTMEAWNRSPLAGRKLTLERLIGAQLAQQVARHYEAANTDLALMLGLPLAELGYPVADSASTSAVTGESTASRPSPEATP